MYITKNCTRDELFNAYRSSQAEIKKLKRLHGLVKESKRKQIDNKKQSYSKLSYQLFKEKQKVYGRDIHIENIKRKILTKSNEAKRKAYEKAISQIKERDGRIIDMYTFLGKMNTVSSIIGLSLVECSFLLWAGTYNFFSSRDFNRDCNNIGFKFYVVNARMIKKGFVVEMENRDSKTKMFALSGTGLSMFDKIDKFTKKQFE